MIYSGKAFDPHTLCGIDIMCLSVPSPMDLDEKKKKNRNSQSYRRGDESLSPTKNRNSCRRLSTATDAPFPFVDALPIDTLKKKMHSHFFLPSFIFSSFYEGLIEKVKKKKIGNGFFFLHLLGIVSIIAHIHFYV